MTLTVAGLCKVEKPHYRRIRTLVGQYYVVATPIHSFRELWIWVSVWRVLKVLWRGSESEVSSRHKPCKRRRRVLPWLCPQQRDCKRGVQQRALRWVELLPVTASPFFRYIHEPTNYAVKFANEFYVQKLSVPTPKYVYIWTWTEVKEC